MSAGADGALRFDVITLFPELFAPFLEAGVARRAYASGQIDLKLWNPRDYADGNYRRVDDRPFGGGPGMVMLAEPLARCLAAAQAERADGAAAPVVLTSRADSAAAKLYSIATAMLTSNMARTGRLKVGRVHF